MPKKTKKRRKPVPSRVRWDALWSAYIAALKRGDKASAEKAKRGMRAFDAKHKFAPMAFYRK